MDFAARYTDTSGRFSCPVCHSGIKVSYVVIPESTRQFGDTTEFWGASRDYLCHNCDAEWIISEDFCHG